MIHPENQRHARIWALLYVRQLTAKGYTPAKAAAEICLGRGGPNEAGYNISHGKISVPSCRPNWTFNFAALAKEVSAPVRKPMRQEVLAL